MSTLAEGLPEVAAEGVAVEGAACEVYGGRRDAWV